MALNAVNIALNTVNMALNAVNLTLNEINMALNVVNMELNTIYTINFSPMTKKIKTLGKHKVNLKLKYLVFSNN